MGTIVVLKHELGTKREQYTCQKVHWEKSKEIHLHTARVLQKYNQALLCLVQEQLLKRWCQWNNRTHGHFRALVPLKWNV